MSLCWFCKVQDFKQWSLHRLNFASVLGKFHRLQGVLDISFGRVDAEDNIRATEVEVTGIGSPQCVAEQLGQGMDSEVNGFLAIRNILD